MQGLTTFIMHSNVAEVLQSLDNMLVVDEESGETPGILLLLGLPKTGKDCILNYWMNRERLVNEQSQRVERPPIIKANVWKPRGDTLGRNVYTTPITCRTFSEVVFELGELSSRSTPTYGKKWYVEPKGLYTDSQFDSLFAFVRSEVKRLRIRAVVINNAQLIDGWTLEALVLLRKHCGNTLSVILCAQLAEKADLDEPLDEAFGRVPEAAEICTRVVLQRLTKKEYQAVILPALAENLNLSFADDLLEAEVAKRVPNALWQHTKFDWKAIDDFAKAIKYKIPDPQNGRPRKLTRAILEDILGRPLDL